MEGLGIFSYTTLCTTNCFIFFFPLAYFFYDTLGSCPKQFFFFKETPLRKHPLNTFTTQTWDNSINADYFPGNITPGILCSLALVQTDRNLQLSSWDFLFSLSSDGFSSFWKLCCPPTLYFNFNGMHLLIIPEGRCMESKDYESKKFFVYSWC